MKKYTKKIKNLNMLSSGFTLIEIMVATSIFMMIMLIAFGTLISTSNTAKQSQALRSAMDNVNFAMESMTRSLRTGTDYYCIRDGDSVSLPASEDSISDCPLSNSSGGAAIVFTPPVIPSEPPQPRRNAAYRVIERGDRTGTHVLQRCTPKCFDLVSEDVDITKLTFFVEGSNPEDQIQPSVYIIIKGTVVAKGVSTTFAIQTMTSQRSFE